MNTFIEEKVKEFESSYAYKFDHKQGCKFYSDDANSEMCTCGAMKELESFLRQALEECWEKGYWQGVDHQKTMNRVHSS